jgi:hypothetical protein
MDLASRHPYDIQNFVLASKCLANLWTSGIRDTFDSSMLMIELASTLTPKRTIISFENSSAEHTLVPKLFLQQRLHIPSVPQQCNKLQIAETPTSATLKRLSNNNRAPEAIAFLQSASSLPDRFCSYILLLRGYCGSGPYGCNPSAARGLARV